MYVLHPLLLWGAAFMALPLCAHLFAQSSRRKIYFAPIALLWGAQAASPAWAQLSHRLLLVLRMALVVILALVVAHVAPKPQHTPGVLAPPQAVVWVIDTSASMNYQMENTSLLRRAQNLAQQGLAALPSLAQAGVVVTEPREQGALTSTQTLLDPVRAQEATTALIGPKGMGHGDLATALAEAAAMLAQSAPGALQEIVVIGDLSQNTYAGLGAWRVDPDHRTTLRFVDVADRVAHTQGVRKPLENAAVVGMAVSSAPSGQGAILTVRIKNYGSEAILGRGLHCAHGGRSLGRGFVDCGPQQMCEKQFVLPQDVLGQITVTAALAPDARDGYSADDTLQADVSVLAPTRVLAVNGPPLATAHNDPLFFVSRALAQVPAGAHPIVTTRIDKHTLGDVLASAIKAPTLPFEVLVLANVADLTLGEAQKIAHLRRLGLGLVVALGDGLQATQDAGAHAVEAVMPYALRDTFRASDAAGTGGPVRIGAIATSHPMLQGLGFAAFDSLRHVGTQTYMHVTVQHGCLGEVLMAYATGAPALLWDPGRDQMGSVALFTSTLDAAWTDLPLSGAFVPLMQRVVHAVGQKAVGHSAVTPSAHGPLSQSIETTESDFTPVTQAVLEQLSDNVDPMLGPYRSAKSGADRSTMGWVSALMILLWTLWGIEAWWSTPQTLTNR